MVRRRVVGRELREIEKDGPGGSSALLGEVGREGQLWRRVKADGLMVCSIELRLAQSKIVDRDDKSRVNRLRKGRV